MGCPACKIDYAGLERKIDSGYIRAEEELLDQLAGENLFISGGVVIYCPSCLETLQRLKMRIASRLRKETLANIGVLLDRAHEGRKLKRK